MLSLRHCPRLPSSLLRRSLASSNTPSETTSDPLAEEAEPDLDLGASARHPDEFLSRLDDTREDIEPVAKNLFLGKLDLKVLSFPDVLQNDRYFALQNRCQALRDHFDSKKESVERINEEQKVSKDLLLPLRSLGAFGLGGALSEGGQGLGLTESFKVTEEFGVNLSVSRIMTEANILGTRAIARWGTEALRSKLMEKLLSGELLGSVCMADAAGGTDPMSTTCKLKFNEERGAYELTGGKTWVTNAPNADVFTVFARILIPNHVSEMEEFLCAVVVQKGMKGFSVGQPIAKAGLKGVQVADLTFDQVEIPEENLLGSIKDGADVLADLVLLPRAFNALEMCTALRTLLDKTLQHTMTRRSFGKLICDFDIVKHRLGVMAGKIYALESMLYMTAGLADVMKNPDVEVEANMCKLYAVDLAREMTNECLLLHGGQSYLEDSSLAAVAQDLRAFELWEGSPDLVSSYITLCGFQALLGESGDKMTMLRDTLGSPLLKFKDMWNKRRMSLGKSPKLSLGLHQGLHPSLLNQANKLEHSILRLAWALESAALNNGVNLAVNEVDLCRLATCATECYAMTSALSRASRSYCVGHQDSDHEVEMAVNVCFDAELKVEKLSNFVASGFFANNDCNVSQVGSHLIDRGRYSAVHPTTKNVF